MIITATQAGNWTRIRREDGIHVEEWTMPNAEAEDIYYALHALFQIRPPLEPSESASDA